MANRFEGRVICITGAAKGIGRQAALSFAAEGAIIVATDIEAVAGKALVVEIEGSGGKASFIKHDVTSEDAWIDAIAAIRSKHGKLDVLINNAGVAWGATLEEFPESGWDKVMDVNVKGIFFLFQKLMPLLRKSASADDPARVINIASIDGMHTSPFSGYAYGTSKAAVIHLTRFMASQHVGEHILVNGIAPGPFPTWMLSTGVGFGGKTEGVDWDSVAKGNPSGRVGTPQDIAGLAMFLSSRAGAYISGHTIPCDGGIVSSS